MVTFETINKTPNSQRFSDVYLLFFLSEIADGHVTIFEIRLQTLMKLVGQAKYLST